VTDAPTMRTGRLTLRPHRLDDFPAMAAFFASDAARYVGGPIDARRAWYGFGADVGSWALMGLGAWAIEETASGAFLGQVALTKPAFFPERELGWIVFPAHQRRGFGREAAVAALGFAWGALDWDTAISYVDRDNEASRALARSLGAVEDPEAERWDDADVVYRHRRPEALA